MREEIQKLINQLRSEINSCSCRAACDCGKDDMLKSKIAKQLQFLLDVNEVTEDVILNRHVTIDTVGTLREVIRDVPDDTKIYYYNGSETYTMGASIRTVKCLNVRTGEYISKGLILDQNT